MTLFRRAMNYLGLGPEDEYYDDEVPVERAPMRAGRSNPSYEPEGVTVRPVARGGGAGRDNVREFPTGRGAEPEVTVVTRPRAGSGSAVRTVAAAAATPLAKPTTVIPQSFNDAQEVGDRYREGQPVIINLEGLDREVSRRIIDFTSGLCYALSGRMERVANGVYLLTPSSPEPADEQSHYREYED